MGDLGLLDPDRVCDVHGLPGRNHHVDVGEYQSTLTCDGFGGMEFGRVEQEEDEGMKW